MMPLPTRQDAIDAATKILADPAAVFLKVETTGIGPRDEVVEIAIVHAITGDVLLNSLVRPSFRYPMHDKLLHGITYDMVADAPTIEQLNIRHTLFGQKAIVYGKTFARDLIAQSYAASGIQFHSEICTWHCVMTLYGAYHGELSWKGDSYRYWKFDDVCDNLHVNNTQRNHRALEEAKTIGLLLYQITYRGDAVKVKRDPLPRYIPLDFEEIDAPIRPRQSYDQNAFFASTGYPDDQDEFDSYDDLTGDD